MDLREYLTAIRQFWWVIFLAVVVLLGTGVYSIVTAEVTYRSSVTFFVKTTGEGNVGAAAQADQFAQRRVNSYGGLLGSERFANLVIAEGELDLTAREVSRMLTAVGGIDSVLLTATVEGADKEEVEKIGQAVALAFPRFVAEVEGQGVGDTGIVLELVSGPILIEVTPGKTSILGVRLAIGLFLGVTAAVVLRLRYTAIGGRADAERLGLVPVLAEIPATRQMNESLIGAGGEVGSQRAEAFRHLRTNLNFLDAENPLCTVVVTSPVAGEGKSACTANLAISLAATGARVLAIEADLRRPGLAKRFDFDPGAGLTDVLIGRAACEDVLQQWGESSLWVLPSGTLPPNPSELLGGKSMKELLEKLRGDFDLILIDTPPVLPVADALALAADADGTIVVVRANKTKRQEIERAHAAIHNVGGRFLGVVLNFVAPKRAYGYTTYGPAPSSSGADSGGGRRSKRRETRRDRVQ
jgi:capsular exopolysaccharide synthesis family protein